MPAMTTEQRYREKLESIGCDAAEIEQRVSAAFRASDERAAVFQEHRRFMPGVNMTGARPSTGGGVNFGQMLDNVRAGATPKARAEALKRMQNAIRDFPEAHARWLENERKKSVDARAKK